jgi:hypothetical protein
MCGHAVRRGDLPGPARPVPVTIRDLVILPSDQEI